MQTITQLVTQIELRIKTAQKAIDNTHEYISDLNTTIKVIQSECKHIHDDGTTAFEELGVSHGKTIEICTICKMEATR